MTAEQIKNLEEHEKYLIKILECVYSDHKKDFFEEMSSKANNFGDFFCHYLACTEELTTNLTENLYFFSSGCTFDDCNLTAENGTPITKESDRDDVFKAFIMDFENNKRKLDFVFLQYAEKFVGKISIANIEELKNKIDALQLGHRPKYITGLIDEGFLLPDGRTAVVGLERIAEYLHTHIEAAVTPEILLQFRQINGLPFTKRTAQSAATGCKPQ